MTKYKGFLALVRERRVCVDCHRTISDRRFKIRSKGKRCKDCQKDYRTKYLHDYWQQFRDKYLRRRKNKAGGVRDKFTLETEEKAAHKGGTWHSGVMVKIIMPRMRPAPPDERFEYDCSPEKIAELRTKYGEMNVHVLG